MLGTSVGGVLNNSALGVGTSRNGHNIGGVLDSDNHTSSKLDLLPDLTDINQVDTIGSSHPNVVFHLGVEVLGTNVGLRSDKHANGLFAEAISVSHPWDKISLRLRILKSDVTNEQ